MDVPKRKRLDEVYRRLMNAPCAATADEVFRQLSNIINEVEDQWTSTPYDPSNW
jgi:hypothetical protein